MMLAWLLLLLSISPSPRGVESSSNEWRQVGFANISEPVVVSSGEAAFLPCHVLILDNRNNDNLSNDNLSNLSNDAKSQEEEMPADLSVSWMRSVDLKILSIGNTAYSPDPRISPLYRRLNSSLLLFTLKIAPTNLKDAGQYECQLSLGQRPRTITHTIMLHVRDTHAVVIPGPSLHLEPGSALALSCRVRLGTTRPSFVLWYADELVVNYDDHVHVQDVVDDISDDMLVSKLSLDNARPANYTCAPANARPSSVTVHLINQDSFGPASMQHNSENLQNCNLPTISACLTLITLMTP